MLKSSEFNSAVPKFTNGNYASNPLDPTNIEEPSAQDYVRGTEPLDTLPAQWWNWLCNQFTSRFNKLNTYVKNIFDELTGFLSLLNISPDGTESDITTGQLKNAFKEDYPVYINNKLELGTTYVKKTQKVNNHALSGDITISKSDVGLGNVANTGDSANASSGGTTKFTTGGAYNLLSSIAPYFSTSTAYAVGALITYQNRLYECTTAHSAGAWDAGHFTARSVQYIISNYILPSLAPAFSTSTAYAVGDFVTYQNKLYRCKATHSAGAWNTSHFELANINNVSVDTDGKLALKADLLDLAPAFSTSTNYSIGSYVTYNGNLYRFKQAHSAGAWSASEVTVVTVGGDLALKADKTSLAVPSDAVLHYSFDDVPDYPDGTSDVRLIDNNTYGIQSTDARLRNNGGSSFGNDNGNLTVTITGGEATSCYIDKASVYQKIVKLKIKVTSITGALRIVKSSDVYLRAESVGEYEIENYVDSENPLFFWCTGTGNSCTFTVEAIYIGDGSYSTPVIDNANGQNNATNNGGIATKGVSGKGIYLLQGKFVDMGTSFQLNENFTISIWVKPDNSTSGLYCDILSKSQQIIIRNGQTDYNALLLWLYGESSTLLNQQSIGALLPANTWTNLVITRNGTSLKIYENGTQTRVITLADATIRANNNTLRLSNSANTRPQSIDDFLIFDRALTDDEVTALYLNKANTPKYYDVSATPAENGTMKFSTGGAYDFFGGNTKSASWLNKVFGYALCRDWKTVNTGVGIMYYLNDFFIDSGAKWSTDGLHWTQGTVQGAESPSFSDVKYANGIYVSCGWTRSVLQWSTNGKNWTPATGIDPTEEIEYFTHIEYGNGLWVATGGSIEHDGAFWSTDGKAWTQGTVPNNTRLYDAKYANNIWVATSWGKGIFYSTDGKTWTQASGAPTTEVWFGDIAYANGTFVTGCWSFRGYASKGTWWSDDGMNWTECTGIGTSYYTSGIYYAKGIWLSRKSSSGIIISTDGKAWETTNITMDSAGGFCYANGLFVCILSGRIYVATNPYYWHKTNLVETSEDSDRFATLLYAQNKWLLSGDVLRYSDYSVLVENGFFTD